MTQIELETYNAVKSAARKYLSLNERVDWEERRYEIAKEIMASFLSEYHLEFKTDNSGVLNLTNECQYKTDLFAKGAVLCADALIKQLKEK